MPTFLTKKMTLPSTERHQVHYKMQISILKCKFGMAMKTALEEDVVVDNQTCYCDREGFLILIK